MLLSCEQATIFLCSVRKPGRRALDGRGSDHGTIVSLVSFALVSQNVSQCNVREHHIGWKFLSCLLSQNSGHMLFCHLEIEYVGKQKPEESIFLPWEEEKAHLQTVIPLVSISKMSGLFRFLCF